MPLSARMPDLTALELLLAVARLGSLGAAGRELGLSQQAVSARIAATEARTGVRLVTRTPRGSELTTAGRLAAGWADRLLQAAHEVDAGMASLRHDLQARLRISASLTVAEQLLPGWLVSLQLAAQRRGETAADVVLTATNSDLVADGIRHGRADLGFVEGSRAPAGLRSRVIAHDQLVLVVRPEHRWAKRSRPVAPAELAATALVSREPGSGTREFLETAVRSRLGPDAVLAAPALELSTSTAVRAAVLAGAAPAVLSRLAINDDITTGRLRTVPIAELDLHRALRAVWAGARTPPAGAVRDLLAHISAVQQASSA